jgi:predicted RNase H-like HicB family nuclease
MNYKVIIFYDPEYQGYVIEVPELTGCMSQGKTLAEARINIKDAIKGWLHVEEKHHRDPHPRIDEYYLSDVTV